MDVKITETGVEVVKTCLQVSAYLSYVEVASQFNVTRTMKNCPLSDLT